MSDSLDQQPTHFLRLLAEHEPGLRTFLRSLLPSPGDASEVMQEVAVVLWRKFAEFDATRDFRKWAFGVARYEALSFLRDRSRDRHVFDDALVHQMADDAVAAESRHERQRDALEGCLQKLPEPQRALMLAAYAKGTRLDQLAARRGQTAMSLYKMVHRQRQVLLQCVQRAMAREEPL